MTKYFLSQKRHLHILSNCELCIAIAIYVVYMCVSCQRSLSVSVTLCQNAVHVVYRGALVLRYIFVLIKKGLNM